MPRGGEEPGAIGRLMEDYRPTRRPLRPYVSVGRFRACRRQFYETYFKRCRRNVGRGRVMVLHRSALDRSGCDEPLDHEIYCPVVHSGAVRVRTAVEMAGLLVCAWKSSADTIAETLKACACVSWRGARAVACTTSGRADVGVYLAASEMSFRKQNMRNFRFSSSGRAVCDDEGLCLREEAGCAGSRSAPGRVQLAGECNSFREL